MNHDLQIIEDSAQLAERCADHLVTLARTAIAERGVFTLCAAGGTTPRGVYALLAKQERAERLDWPRIQIYFGDERCVGPDDEESNYRMLRESLLEHVAIPAGNVHRIVGELDPNHAAHDYADVLRAALGQDEHGAPDKTFDLVMLGMGADGHTASLFPGSNLAQTDWVSARQKPVSHDWRVTLTEPVLNAAKEVIFLVTGAEKAERLAEVVQGTRDLVRLPAQRIAPRGLLRFWVDQRAGAKLTGV